MNVLSLFDGMSCGQIALNRAGIKYDNYFASEIDKYAIKVTQHNYPDTIQLGSVVDVKASELPVIDLLIGGSPCQGFSFAGKQLNFEDERSKLFFEYVRLLKECKPKYFLLENVKMKKEHELVINKYLGCRPMRFNSALVSAQNRERLYWTNIPVNSIPKNLYITLQDIMDNNTQRKFRTINNKESISKKRGYVQFDNSGKGYESQYNRAYYLDGKAGTLAKSRSSHPKVFIENNAHSLSIQECCRLQTVPENYFTGVLSDMRALECLGNGWTIDIIVNIFKHMVL